MSAKIGAPFDAETGFDATYAERHKQRNRRKTRRILTHIEAGDRFLDIGCNAGYVSGALLRTNMAKRVDAIELNRSIVDQALLEDTRFNFFEGSVTDYPFPCGYTGTIYCAVHHHIFGLYGKFQAFLTWRKIIEHSDRFVIFETGQILEGEKYYWQRAIRSYYPSDERHLGDLLLAIGPRLKDVRVIGYMPIHGVKRVLLKIELHPRGSNYDIAATGTDAYEKLLNDTTPWVAVKRFRRTIGTRSQELIDIEQSPRDDVSNIYEGTTFCVLRDELTGQQFFAKRTEDNPFKLLRELKIIMQLKHSRIVSPVAVNSTFGMIFPYLSYVPLHALSANKIKDRDRFIAQILEFFRYAREVEVDLGLLDYPRNKNEPKRRLIDVVDLNLSNILVNLEEGIVRDWVIVDLEYVGNQTRARNEKHLAGIMEFFEYTKADLIIKNPFRVVLKQIPYLSRYARTMNRIPFSAIVDGEPGRGRPRVLVLESRWTHLFRALTYSWLGKASIEERVFGDDAALRQSRLTGIVKKLRKKVWKKARRFVAKSPLGN